jgi:hypothetical protein
MKKLLVVLTLALSLGACASLQTAYKIVTGASVSPTQIVVAANAFDALEGTATQYLVYCKANLATAVCSADNRRSVIKYVRSGRTARNQLEPYITSGSAGPSALYNTLIASINQLNLTPAAQGAQK